jgi:tubulin gamma
VKNYDKLMYKNAFINNYLKSDYEHECGDILQEFQDSRDVVEALINEYRSSGTLAYMEGSSDEEEVGDIEVDDIEMQ